MPVGSTENNKDELILKTIRTEVEKQCVNH
jgi:hypothetical protein